MALGSSLALKRGCKQSQRVMKTYLLAAPAPVLPPQTMPVLIYGICLSAPGEESLPKQLLPASLSFSFAVGRAPSQLFWCADFRQSCQTPSLALRCPRFLEPGQRSTFAIAQLWPAILEAPAFPALCRSQENLSSKGPLVAHSGNWRTWGKGAGSARHQSRNPLDLQGGTGGGRWWRKINERGCERTHGQHA